MHFGPVDSYNGLKRRSLERTIFVSGGLRSRYPPNKEPSKVTEDVGWFTLKTDIAKFLFVPGQRSCI